MRDGLSPREIADALDAALARAAGAHLRRALLIVPDFTRYHSGAGFIASYIFHRLQPRARVDLLEALGTHAPMSRRQRAAMYGDIPAGRFIPHNWRAGTVKLGEVPAGFVREVSEGLMEAPIAVEVNRLLFDGYDLILSIGQVVPHEVAGMANHSKNIFVGCGGADMINASHMLGAFYGMERIMGRENTPVRRVLDYAAGAWLAGLPLHYILTVTAEISKRVAGNERGAGDERAGAGFPEKPNRASRSQGIARLALMKDACKIAVHGLFAGRGRECFRKAAALAREKNITLLDAPLAKAVVYLNEEEFRSTWLGNKAIYRTRMAMADGGELIVLAPGVARFGEDGLVDALIRKYGYCGREKIIRLFRAGADLQSNMSAAAHLIHGSSDGRFSVTYCTRHLSAEEVTGAGFCHMPYEEAAARYNPQALLPGVNSAGGQEFFYIPNPALGLWADKNKF